MSDLALVVVVGLITFASRVVLMVRPQPVWGTRVSRFLEVFPLALFMAIATAALVAPDGRPAVTPALAAAGGGVLGAVVFKKSLLGVLVVGAVAFYGVRSLTG